MTSPTSTVLSKPKPKPNPNPDDLVVILAALLCAVICVLGLFAVARCAWIRRLSSSPAAIATFSSPPGLKKKVLESLPKLTISADEVRSEDCAICLSEFVVGEEVRVLPECGHWFHVVCIDRWLVSHSSCPSCRRVLVTGDSRCRSCGGGGAAAMAAATFLP